MRKLLPVPLRFHLVERRIRGLQSMKSSHVARLGQFERSVNVEWYWQSVEPLSAGLVEVHCSALVREYSNTLAKSFPWDRPEPVNQRLGQCHSSSLQTVVAKHREYTAMMPGYSSELPFLE